MQIIQRGYKTPDAQTVPPGQGYAVGEADFTFSINIPAQQSTPDFRCSVVLKSGQDRGFVTESGKPGYNITYTPTQITVVVVRGSSNQFTGVDGLSYSVFRKRTTG
ncbi:hypothetical protein [Methylobacterium gnaphalii]|nr:hypothetical protein [Methylobacterium gnaphalii]